MDTKYQDTGSHSFEYILEVFLLDQTCSVYIIIIFHSLIKDANLPKFPKKELIK